MKITFCLVLLFHIPLLCHSLNLDHLTISAGDPNALNTGGSNEIEADKRSGGSFSFISSIKSGLLSSLGRASASFASGSSGGSSGGGYKSTEAHANSVDFDPWSLKKSVLNTIFQAVKAITGGVTALKGQLIKGSGYAISAGGKLIAASGDKVTDVGKGIISSAQLSPPNPHPAPHPFANKFSGLASLSGASSALSSSSHDTRFETNVPSSESITSFDIPTGHANYGAPAKAPSYTATVTKYIPTGTYTSGAGGHTSGSGGQFTAAAYEGPHISGITYPKYGLPGEAV